MDGTGIRTAPASQQTEHFDVLIVGAGISGVGGAYHLTKQCPGTSFVVLEAQDSFGGTWLTHRYPGIRSDSDLYTFGYRFKPWTGAPIATAAEILRYMGEVIERERPRRAYPLPAHDRLGVAGRARRISGRSMRPGRTPARLSGSPRTFFGCARAITGTAQGYTPEWEGMADFQGPDRSPANLA